MRCGTAAVAEHERAIETLRVLMMGLCKLNVTSGGQGECGISWTRTYLGHPRRVSFHFHTPTLKWIKQWQQLLKGKVESHDDDEAAAAAMEILNWRSHLNVFSSALWKTNHVSQLPFLQYTHTHITHNTSLDGLIFVHQREVLNVHDTHGDPLFNQPLNCRLNWRQRTK